MIDLQQRYETINELKINIKLSPHTNQRYVRFLHGA